MHIHKKLLISIIIVNMSLSAVILYLILLTPPPTGQTRKTASMLLELNHKMSSIETSLEQLIDTTNHTSSIIRSSALETHVHEAKTDHIESTITTNNTINLNDEKISEIIRLLQADIVNGKTITFDFFNKTEIQQLSKNEKKQIISKVMEMVNSGEINADTFLKKDLTGFR